VSYNPELEPYDPMCERTASELEYLDSFLEEGQTRAEYVLRNEGTLNRVNLHFLCDECYIKAGMPTSPTGWKCP
jgi:hypothetical protein